MKIAQIVCTFPPYKGGIGNSAYNFYNFFTDDNCQITTFTPQYNTQTKTDKNIKRIKPLLKYGNGAFLPQIFFQLKNFDYIYLHYPFFGTAEIIWLFKLFFKKPKLIIHYHMDVKNLSLVAKILSLPSILIRSSLFKQADKVICASSDYIKNSCIKNLYNKYPEKFCEIPLL